ncbi:MAG TPA: hypothetical protein VMS98_11910 [Thermoanaerobaculia bacterium]|nr:hypothetical protein [Thermoanaerobaculia bacterium]
MIAEHAFPADEQQRAPDEVRLFHHQVDGLPLRQFARAEVPLFVRRAAGVDEVFQMRLVDELLEKLPRGWLPGQIVFDELDALTFQVGDGLTAARSGRFEVDLGAPGRHFFRTHH